MKGILYLIIFIFITFSITYWNPYDCSIKKNIFTTDVSIDTVPGLKFDYPWVLVSKIPTHPVKICIESSANTLNCKLVKFIPKYYKEFIEVEDFRYYWFSNRISFNMGHRNEYRGIYDVIKGYSYDTSRNNKFIEEIYLQ